MSTRSSGHDFSSLAYAIEPGVQTWDGQASLSEAASFKTATIIAPGKRMLDSLASLLQLLFGEILPHFPTIVRWSTEGRLVRRNKLQMHRLYAEAASSFPGYTDTYLDFPDREAIACYASRFVPPFDQRHLEVLMVYRHTALILSPDAGMTPKDVCEALRPYARGLDSDGIAALLAHQPGWMIARYYNQACAPYAWQFHGGLRHIHGVSDILRGCGLRELEGLGEVATLL
jgi:hypothetical protein